MNDSLKNVRQSPDQEYGATSAEDYDAGWLQWADMVKYSPAPFHRRRLILQLARRIKFESVVDVGCGTGEMLRAFREVFAPKRMAGSDLSAAVVQRNQREMPYATFFAADLAKRPLPGSWDLIVCSEVIEHIPDYQAALRHLRTMCNGHMIVTVPRGRIFPIDLAMGHQQHFSESELGGALQSTGFRPSVVWRWGFPWHTLYKHLINLSPDAAMNRFSGGAYSSTDKLISRALKTLFYLNSKRMGTQLVVLAKAV